jgi:prevent-host-death family protein
MPLVLRIDAIEQLPQTPATDVKKLGWRGVMRSVARSGKVVVTNHGEPEAVILSVQEYAAIQSALHEAAKRTEPALEALSQRFDERLAVLQQADAGKRMRTLMRSPARLDGKVKAGSGF